MGQEESLMAALEPAVSALAHCGRGQALGAALSALAHCGRGQALDHLAEAPGRPLAAVQCSRLFRVMLFYLE